MKNFPDVCNEKIPLLWKESVLTVKAAQNTVKLLSASIIIVFPESAFLGWNRRSGGKFTAKFQKIGLAKQCFENRTDPSGRTGRPGTQTLIRSGYILKIGIFLTRLNLAKIHGPSD